MKTTEKIETLFESSNFDSKNITNKGAELIEQETLSKIETNGVTLEFLNTLKAPVFKYRTQITIHGIFPTLENNYLGGYKRLFQNKNLSIGVKWDAVDFEKKQTIYNKVCSYLRGWNKRHNSSEFYIYKCSKSFNSREEYKEMLISTQAEIAHINNKLFFGNCSVYLVPQIWGGYYLQTVLNIGAILETNVVPCIENICQKTLSEIETELTERKNKYAAECAAENLKRQQAQDLIDLRQAPILDAAKQQLLDAGYIYKSKEIITEGAEFIKVTINDRDEINFECRKFTKTKQQRDWRRKDANSKELNFVNFGSDWKYSLNTYSGYVKQAAKIEQKAANVQSFTNAQKVETAKSTNILGANVNLIKYSEKAIVIIGDTKSIKDSLKKLGGKFNPYLSCGAGWIFPATKQNEISNLLFPTIQFN